ncbi:DUF488 domain-containing protein [Pedomonas mirosovicensis]|uniref:DUF488 domain-containing protein n=1 Tax=Pedomonas mirosovicensis TaxID=2908641 RepID=UPI002168029D|nr:DUF488 family protein [Pedomonas mirosovicensis]MCH8686572.1 DUF488 family protein [Pedomonas mirosovicensis]
MTSIRTKRIYDPATPDDGCRILIDRLWPRGLKKQEAAIDHWAKSIAPSTELRQWLHADPGRWPDFPARYRDELRLREDELRQLLERGGDGPLTLLYSAKDRDHNHALVLKEVLEELQRR